MHSYKNKKQQESQPKSIVVQGLVGPIPHSTVGLCLEDIKVDGDTFTSIGDGVSTILFDPVVKKGVVKFEVLNIKELECVGIADESVQLNRNEKPEDRGWDKIVMYDYCIGWIGHIGDSIEGNAAFKTGDRVALELNMDSIPRTLTFFKNDEEQPLFVSGIPAAVRAHLQMKGDSFQVLKFESLPNPLAKHGEGSRSLKFGNEWKEDK
ncbi:MAG: hypothetical protein EZS28_006584 [Streblomastix strix]|uniref:SPRY domain-containing protein n=1 Tax=Streblomastix strix TaxID=222440 RepID=A0A5J4WUP3_9EUKA|nr:MAG: hypothetical protein EZS28_006584 [Streblomastix strix]